MTAQIDYLSMQLDSLKNERSIALEAQCSEGGGWYEDQKGCTRIKRGCTGIKKVVYEGIRILMIPPPQNQLTGSWALGNRPIC